MVSPYKHVFDKLDAEKEAGVSDLQVRLDRNGADSLVGKFFSSNDFGCTIKLPGIDEEHTTLMFVAYEDIRGVGRGDWDYDIIG